MIKVDKGTSLPVHRNGVARTDKDTAWIIWQNGFKSAPPNDWGYEDPRDYYDEFESWYSEQCES